MFRFTPHLFCLCAAASVAAHDNATGIVKERMDSMKHLSTAMKSLLEQTQAATPNPSTIQSIAIQLQEHAGQTITDHFPKGSLDHPTEALPSIWENWSRFETLAQQLDLHAKGLALAAANPLTGNTVEPRDDRTLDDLAQMGPDEIFTLLGKNCTACHQEFRLKKN